ncbi:MAG: hypothetical protein GC161_10120 [Planctomycetaceae bacterium]|nr:hypothetical protein [Planctomycetaceae bacterium]
MARFTTLAALLLAPSTTWAADLFVAPGGGPGTFASISAAVAAAAPDDQIHVAAGTYIETVFVDKPLAIFAAPGAVLQHPVVTLLSPETLEVRDIALGEEVVISGLKVVGTSGSQLSQIVIHTIGVENCAGRVVLHDIEVETRRFSALVLADADHVQLMDSRIYPNVGSVSECCLHPAVQVANSTLFASNSSIDGLPMPSPGSFPFAINTEAMVANFSRVVLHGCELTGGAGGPNGLTATWGAPAIEAFGSIVELRGTSAQGGAGGVLPPSPLLPQGAIGQGGPGVTLLSSSQSVVDQGTTTVGGLSGDGLAQAAGLEAFSGSSAVTSPVSFPLLRVAAPSGPGAIGQPMALALTGLPNERHFLFLSAQSAIPGVQPGIAGEFLLDSVGLNYLGRVPLDAQGVGQWSTTVPADPALIGLTAFFQTLSPVTAFPAFGNPALLPITG